MATPKDTCKTDLKKAALAIKNARALIITAGAGMGVDSGLPDYRGTQGFWRAYPLLKDMGINFQQMAMPERFEADPEFAWGFKSHQYHLYCKTEPHEGYQILKRWARSKEEGYFVYTSNVSREIWPASKEQIKEVDPKTLRMLPPLPHGPPGAKKPVLARPNVLMFDDWTRFNGDRSYGQQEPRFEKFYERLGPLDFVIIEIGSGTAVPTIRYKGESLVEQFKGATLIRINPLQSEVPEKIKHKCISLPMKGLGALHAIDKLMK